MPPGAGAAGSTSAPAARLSALHGIAGAMTPRNFVLNPPDAETASLFFRRFGIGFVAGDPAEVERVFPAALLAPLPDACGLPLYRVGAPEP